MPAVLVLLVGLAGTGLAAGCRSAETASARDGAGADGQRHDVAYPSDPSEEAERPRPADVAADASAVADVAAAPDATGATADAPVPADGGDATGPDRFAQADQTLPRDALGSGDAQDADQRALPDALSDLPLDGPVADRSYRDEPLPDGSVAPESGGATFVTLAVGSDIAEEGRTAHARAVAAVTGLLLGGDNARYDGTGTLLNYYRSYYAPPAEADFGQFDAMAFPQLGNHEYNESDAQGYFDYFASRLSAIAALPSYHGSSNSVGQGWYSVDINGWHVVSLNSNCTEISGGCGSGGAQDRWLVADLAAHGGMPLIGIWHSPRWTCVTDGHGSDSAMQTFWARCYDAHADFVFNGHNHVYQRYQPLDKSDPATVDAAGVTEVVVGSGGVSTYSVCAASADTRVAKALGGDASIGILFLTLGSDGSYQWEYRVKSDGSIFDSGQGRSHNAR